MKGRRYQDVIKKKNNKISIERQTRDYKMQKESKTNNNQVEKQRN